MPGIGVSFLLPVSRCLSIKFLSGTYNPSKRKFTVRSPLNPPLPSKNKSQDQLDESQGKALDPFGTVGYSGEVAFSSSFKDLNGLRQVIKNHIGLWVFQAEARMTHDLKIQVN